MNGFESKYCMYINTPTAPKISSTITTLPNGVAHKLEPPPRNTYEKTPNSTITSSEAK